MADNLVTAAAVTTKKIEWDAVTQRFYETGVDRGVLYVSTDGQYGAGVPWNGLTAVNESPSGAEASPQYADNIKYLNLVSAEDFGFTIEAFTYPNEFNECDGSSEPTKTKGLHVAQQSRKTFGFSYRTRVGNDSDGIDKGYKIHLVYGCLAAPSDKNYQTINDSPEAMTLSWEVTTTPVPVTGMKPTAHIIIDSTTADPTCLANLEKILYGSESGAAKLPSPDEVITTMTPAQ